MTAEQTLSDLKALDRRKIAEMIALTPTWSYLGLSFAQKYGFEITRAMLTAKSTQYAPDDNELAQQLLESLAERLVTIKDFVRALELIGLNSIAAKVTKEYLPDSISKAPIIGDDDIKLEEANRDLKKGDQVLLLKGMNRGQTGKLIEITQTVIVVELEDGPRTFPDKTSFKMDKTSNCKD